MYSQGDQDWAYKRGEGGYLCDNTITHRPCGYASKEETEIKKRKYQNKRDKDKGGEDVSVLCKWKSRKVKTLHRYKVKGKHQKEA